MDIAAIGGAIGAVKALVGMTKATADAISDEKQREKLFEIRAGLMDLQEKVLEDQQSRMELLSKLDSVTKERDSLKSKKSKLDNYELFAISEGHFVFKAKQKEGVATHYACPNCYSSEESINVLQAKDGYAVGNTGTRCWCTHCDFQIYI